LKICNERTRREGRQSITLSNGEKVRDAGEESLIAGRGQRKLGVRRVRKLKTRRTTKNGKSNNSSRKV